MEKTINFPTRNVSEHISFSPMCALGKTLNTENKGINANEKNLTVFLSLRIDDNKKFLKQKSWHKTNNKIVDVIAALVLQSMATTGVADETDNSDNSLARFQIGWLSKLLVQILPHLTKRKKSKNNIGKGVEGFIAYKTWPRPPSANQLVKKYCFIDRLNQQSFYNGDAAWL